MARRLLIAASALIGWGTAALSAAPACPPAWEGTVLIGGQSLQNWSTESDQGSAGGMSLSTDTVSGGSVQFNWSVGAGGWAQAKYTFPVPVDLSNADIFGITLRGAPAQATGVWSDEFMAQEDLAYTQFVLPAYPDGLRSSWNGVHANYLDAHDNDGGVAGINKNHEVSTESTSLLAQYAVLRGDQATFEQIYDLWMSDARFYSPQFQLEQWLLNPDGTKKDDGGVLSNASGEEVRMLEVLRQAEDKFVPSGGRDYRALAVLLADGMKGVGGGQGNFEPAYAHSTATGPGGVEDLSILPHETRYVRVNLLERNTPWGYSLFEIEAYGPDNPASNLALGAAVTASSVQAPEFSPANVSDGDPATRWSSDFSDPQWIELDLGSTRTVDRLVLRWEAASAKAYNVDTQPYAQPADADDHLLRPWFQWTVAGDPISSPQSPTRTAINYNNYIGYYNAATWLNDPFYQKVLDHSLAAAEGAQNRDPSSPGRGLFRVQYDLVARRYFTERGRNECFTLPACDISTRLGAYGHKTGDAAAVAVGRTYLDFLKNRYLTDGIVWGSYDVDSGQPQDAYTSLDLYAFFAKLAMEYEEYDLAEKIFREQLLPYQVDDPSDPGFDEGYLGAFKPRAALAQSRQDMWKDASAFVNLETLIALNQWNNKDKGSWVSAYPRWVTLAAVNGSDGGEDLLRFGTDTVKTRYVRILCKRRSIPQYGYSLWSLEARTPLGADAARGKPVSFSSVEGPSALGSLAVDGDDGTRWASEHGVDPQWITVDLGQETDLNELRIKWEYAYALDYEVQVAPAGVGAAKNDVNLLISDENGVFYGWTIGRGVHRVDRWLDNLPIPKKGFQYRWGGAGPNAPIDWSRISSLFVAVARPVVSEGGGLGSLRIDSIRYDKSADWPRAAEYQSSAGPADAADRAVSYLMGQQKATGLVVSWKEGSEPSGWLYDQALALIAFTRAGIWTGRAPADAPAAAAKRMADFLLSAQQPDGRWARGFNAETGQAYFTDEWVGDQSWVAMALALYSHKSGDPAALAAARKSGVWLAGRISGSPLRAANNTEGNIDTWWAMTALNRISDAATIRDYLMNVIWDPALKYWAGDFGSAFVALDAATWGSAFARHPSVNMPERGLQALSFVRRALASRSDDGALCGIDGMGPVSLWNDGLGQYAAAGGEGAQEFLDTLLLQQRADGGMPGSTDDWDAGLGWLTTWTGAPSTAWFYFALTGAPYNDVPLYGASSAVQAPELAFDGDPATRWESAPSDPQWLAVDFRVRKWMNKVVVRWENAYAKSYKVQVSDDGSAWTDVYATAQGDGGEDVVLFPALQARFLRLSGTERGTAWAYSVWEMSAEFEEPASASSEQSAEFAASFAADGNPSTRWSSEFSDPQWLRLRFNDEAVVNKAVLDWEAGYAKSYRVQVSSDGSSWTDVFVTTQSDGGRDVAAFPPVKAWYLRVLGEERATSWGYSLWDVAVENDPFQGPSVSTVALVSGGVYRPPLVLDAAGNSRSLFFDGAANRLKYAESNGSAWTISTVPGARNAVQLALALDPSGNPHVAYFDSASQELKYTRRSAGVWSAAARVAHVGDVGYFLSFSLAVDAAGAPHLAYLDRDSNTLRYAVRRSSQWRIRDVEGEGYYVSLALDGAGNPRLAYTQFQGPASIYLRYARLDGDTWSFSTVGGHAVNPSLVLDGAGNPRIAYYFQSEGKLNYARWTGAAWETTPLHDEGWEEGRTSALALDGGGDPHIVFQRDALPLGSGIEFRAASLKDGSWSVFSLGAAWAAGSSPSLALDGSGRARVLYLTGSALRQLVSAQPVSSVPPVGGNALSRVQAPGSLRAVSCGAQGVLWSWSDNASHETGFRLYGSSAPSGPFFLIADTGALGVDRSSYTETSAGGRSLYRVVSAVNGGGEASSAMSFCRTPFAAEAAPAADGAFRLGEAYVFPNPAGKGPAPILHVEAGLADEVQLRVYDAAGELVYETTLSGAPVVMDDGEGLQYAYESPWDVSDVPSGAYLCAVRARKAGHEDLRKTFRIGVLK